MTITIRILLGLLLAVGITSCGDDDDGKSSGTDSDSDSDSNVEGEAIVSGTVSRTGGTCPPGPEQFGTGNLCLYLRTACDDDETTVASEFIADWPEGANFWLPDDPQPFEITGVPDGDFELYAFLDGDLTGCESGPNLYDFMASSCTDVTVADQEDVTGVSLFFTSKCP